MMATPTKDQRALTALEPYLVDHRELRLHLVAEASDYWLEVAWQAPEIQARLAITRKAMAGDDIFAQRREALFWHIERMENKPSFIWKHGACRECGLEGDVTLLVSRSFLRKPAYKWEGLCFDCKGLKRWPAAFIHYQMGLFDAPVEPTSHQSGMFDGE